MRLILSIASLTILAGCATALVPESNDPKAKINQAAILVTEQNRPQAAVEVLNQAIELARKQNDKESEAKAEFYLGEIHKSPGSRGTELKDLAKARTHYEKAARLNSEIKFYKNLALVLWSKSGAYSEAENGEVCQALRDARTEHNRSGAAAGDKLAPAFADGKLLASIEEELSHNKCR